MIEICYLYSIYLYHVIYYIVTFDCGKFTITHFEYLIVYISLFMCYLLCLIFWDLNPRLEDYLFFWVLNPRLEDVEGEIAAS